jgi:hypothetical protein
VSYYDLARPAGSETHRYDKNPEDKLPWITDGDKYAKAQTEICIKRLRIVVAQMETAFQNGQHKERINSMYAAIDRLKAGDK